MSLSTLNQSNISTQADTTILQKLSVMAFGAIILFIVGFSPIPEAHNAAHDTRHSLAFPCH